MDDPGFTNFLFYFVVSKIDILTCLSIVHIRVYVKFILTSHLSGIYNLSMPFTFHQDKQVIPFHWFDLPIIKAVYELNRQHNRWVRVECKGQIKSVHRRADLCFKTSITGYFFILPKYGFVSPTVLLTLAIIISHDIILHPPDKPREGLKSWLSRPKVHPDKTREYMTRDICITWQCSRDFKSEILPFHLEMLRSKAFSVCLRFP